MVHTSWPGCELLLLPPAGCAIQDKLTIEPMLCAVCCLKVPEPVGHVSGRNCGGSGLHGLGVGRRKQGHGEELQEEEPHAVCRRSHDHQLLSALSVRRSPGLHLRNHLPTAV